MKTVDDVLKHYGILGMHWGKKKTTVVRSKEAEYVREKKQKDITELSNDEIKKVTERLNLEKEYKKATKKELSAGKKYVLDLLVRIGKEELSAYATKKAKQYTRGTR